MHANSLDANFKNGDFSTPAKVVMTRVGGDVTADRANGNYKKKMLYPQRTRRDARLAGQRRKPGEGGAPAARAARRR